MYDTKFEPSNYAEEVEAGRKDSNIDPTHCNQCSFKSDNKSHLKTHMVKHTFGYKCPKCGNAHATKEILNDHLKVYHKEDGKSFKCDKCTASFMATHSLNQHVKAVHNSPVCRVECYECKKEFPHRNALQEHAKHKHGNPQCCCNDCNEKSTDRNAVRDHVIDITDDDNHEFRSSNSTCRFYLKGRCIKGSTCRFSHPEGLRPANRKPECRNGNSCSFYARGRCRFSHDNTISEPSNQPRQEMSSYSLQLRRQFN